MGQRELPEAVQEAGLAELARAIGQIGNHVEGMRERMRLLEAVVENFPGGISVFDRDLKMVLCNEQQRALLEYPEDLFASGFPSLEELFRFNAGRGEYGPGAVEEHVARRMGLVRQNTSHVYERTRPNGTVVEVRGEPVRGGGFVTTYFDVTEQRRTHAMIAHMAHHDGLTGLPNRALFADRLQTAIALAKRGGVMAMHYLDIDNFKRINNSFGHRAGDELLIGVAERFTGTARENDTVARLGGDEFADHSDGHQDGRRCHGAGQASAPPFRRPFNLARNEVAIRLSSGICICTHGRHNDGRSDEKGRHGALQKQACRARPVLPVPALRTERSASMSFGACRRTALPLAKSVDNHSAGLVASVGRR